MAKTQAMTLRLDPDLKAKVVDRAAKLGISQTELATRVLRWLVEQPIRSTQQTEKF